ncbi:MAG: DUF302 domain-containing protein [Prolixibacteraceae bacterium]|nr:DUF302 domain-containing protein [Prolixibacteraceae bacterium]
MENMVELVMHQTESKLTAEQVAGLVEAACNKYSLALLQTYIYHEIVESKGFPIQRKVFVYNICQAKTASMMLTTNPEFSTFMPCTLAVYEADDKTVLSTMNMEMMLEAVKSNQELFNQASGLFKSFKQMMDELAEGK